MPPLTRTALLALDDRGRQVVSLHAKLTYKISPNGACRRHEVQQPLLIPGADDPEPLRETDVTPIKTATDFILLASAVAPRSQTRGIAVSLHIQGARSDYAVIGDRRCSYTGPGTLAFSEPEPFEAIPLRYERAYGGVDEAIPIRRWWSRSTRSSCIPGSIREIPWAAGTSSMRHRRSTAFCCPTSNTQVSG